MSDKDLNIFEKISGVPEDRENPRKNPEFTYTKLSGPWGPHSGNDGGFIIQWGCKGVGFGELAFYKKDGKIYCDTEMESKKFIRRAILHWLENEVEYVDK